MEERTINGSKNLERNKLALANDPVVKEKKISIELFCIGKDSKGDDDVTMLGRFWNRVESLVFSKETEHDSETQDIQKLLSFKNESGWAILSKGSKVVVSGAGTTILKVFDEFEKWKEYVRKIGFEACFKEHHDKVLQGDRPCCRVDIPITAGKIPKLMKCPHCPRVMGTYVSFKCCHIDGAINGLH